ncbi:MAG: hypothetical protein IPN58_01355 [Anaerolineales bacterium]|nr:hypothetical protein [Anaerolineales bacterium]
MQVANEIAEKSITLVRDHANLLPIHLKPEQRIAVIVPTPEDLTPADTSSYVTPQLAESLRTYHAHVDEFVISSTPDEKEVASVLKQVNGYDLVVIGTINAFHQNGQALMVREIQKLNIPMMVVALRLPYDLAVFPRSANISLHLWYSGTIHARAGAGGFWSRGDDWSFAGINSRLV